MKTRFKLLFSLILLMCITQLQAEPDYEYPPNDEDEIRQFLDEFHKALRAKDLDGVMSYLDDDGLFCGTDKREIWNKTGFYNYLKASGNSETSQPIEYDISTRTINLSEDGKTAISVEQYLIPAISKKIPFRLITQIVKKGDQYKISFFCWNFTPNNRDVPRLNQALE